MSGLLDRLLDASVYWSFDASGFRRHARDFDDPELAYDLSSKTYLVTGANSGIGYSLSHSLLERRATVVMMVRSEERGRAAETTIRESANRGGLELELEFVDVSSRRSIEAFVERWGNRPIDALIHNAGLLPSERQLNEDGIEMTLATHLLGPWLLNERLAPCLEGGRIIYVTSGGMYLKRFDLDALLDDSKDYDGVEAYALTKRGQVICTELWAQRLAPNGTHVHCMHPGWVATPGVEKSLPGFWKKMGERLRGPEEGADTVLWLAVADEPRNSNGELWFDRRRAKKYVFPFTRESKAQREALETLCQSWSRGDLEP